MAHIVTCRLCKQKFNTEKEPFIVVNQKSYYHDKCYYDWIKLRPSFSSNADENFWKESCIDFLYRDLKIGVNFAKFESQWKSFLKPERAMTPKGIYFSLLYYYNIMHGDSNKAQGGIGIIPSIYSNATNYWSNKERQQRGTIDAIIQQISDRIERPVKIITREENENKSKEKWSLDEI